MWVTNYYRGRGTNRLGAQVEVADGETPMYSVFVAIDVRPDGRDAFVTACEEVGADTMDI